MKVIRQVISTMRVLTRARRNRLDLVRALIRRPQLLVGTAGFEVGVMLSASVDGRFKILAESRVASIVACEYCLDIASALARFEGVTEAQLRDLNRFRTSDAFNDEERLVMELAEALTRVPASVDDDLRSRLDAAFRPAQITELVAVIAWENQRARLNQGLGIRPSGFSDGEFCVLPDSLDVARADMLGPTAGQSSGDH